MHATPFGGPREREPLPAWARAETRDRPGFDEILVGYDGTLASRYALDWVGDLASEGARVELLHVVDPLRQGTSPISADDLEDVARELRRSDRLDVFTTVRVGEPRAQFLQAVEDRTPQLVALGADDRPRWGRRLFGSVADAALGRNETSLLLARTPLRRGPVILPHDGSAASGEAVVLGARLAESWRVPAVVLQVIPGLTHEERLPSNALPAELVRTVAAPRREHVSVVAVGGAPGAAIVAHAKWANAPIIVMGRRGQGDPPPPGVGRVAARVARRAADNVLLVGARGERAPTPP